MRTMLDFGLKYSFDDKMQVKCEFKELNKDQHFVYQFSIILTKNSKIDLEPLEILLTEQKDDEEEVDLSFDDEIDKKYQ